MKGFWLMAGLLTGCAGPVLTPEVISERFCLGAPYLGAEPAHATAATVLPGYSTRAQRVAEAIGAAPLLAELAVAPTAMQRLELRQAVLEKVIIAQLDVQIAVAVLDCEGERGDQLRGVLEAREARRTRALTLASIGAGAGTAVVSGVLSLAGAATASAAAGIAGGAAEGSAAGLQLFGAARGRLATRRNLLREAAERPATSALLPPLVWGYLTRALPEGGTVLDEVVAQWRGAGLVDPARMALLLGEGGDYAIEDLQARGAMLDTLEAAIGRMNQGLRQLLAELPPSVLAAQGGPTLAARRGLGDAQP